MGGTEWMDGGKLDVDGRAWRILCCYTLRHWLMGCEGRTAAIVMG